MGQFLQTEYIDTVEIFLIETGTKPEDFTFLEYSKYVRAQKELYGKEKGLPRHRYMNDYLVRDFHDFFNWQIERFKNKVL